MLKLECIFNVPNRCIDEVVGELHSASTPIIKDLLQSCLRRHNCEIDEAIVSEMVKDLCDANPISSALGGEGCSWYREVVLFGGEGMGGGSLDGKS